MLAAFHTRRLYRPLIPWDSEGVAALSEREGQVVRLLNSIL
jgi:hypothetical protein